MIVIGDIKKEIINNIYIRVSSEININGIKKILFFETDKANEKFVCHERADGFLVAVLIAAMKSHSDIKVEPIISERLLYGLNTFLIPALVKMKPDFDNINIYASNTSAESINKYNGVATGISGGVDSFYTVLKNINSNVPDSLKLNYLMLFNAGNFGTDYKASIKKFCKQIEYSLSVSKLLGMPFIWLNSNLMEFIHFPFEQVHTFCNIASALILQNLIKTYYYSSGYSIDDFKLSFAAASHYDLINETALKTEGFEMISYGGLVSRFEKTKYISDYDFVYDRLNICLYPEKAEKELKRLNCSRCPKCLRTMTALDVVGKLKHYNKVFDLSVYEKNKNRYWGYLRYFKIRTHDEFATENIMNAKKYKYKIPKKSYFWMLHKGIKNQTDKLKIIKFIG